jgi:hypothetical protein
LVFPQHKNLAYPPSSCGYSLYPYHSEHSIS